MNLHEIRQYLDGSAFSDDLAVRIDTRTTLRSRNEYIANLVRNKSVLHIGCVDHIPIIEERISSNQWLHASITEYASNCIGIDINDEGISYLRNSHNITNIISHDITQGFPSGIKQHSWDYVILPDVLEHIGNPCLFLTALSRNFSQKASRFLITIPNAFCYSNFKAALRNFEHINTDHRHWYSPFTILKLLTDACLDFDTVTLMAQEQVKMRDRVLLRCFSRTHAGRDALINFKTIAIEGHFR